MALSLSAVLLAFNANAGDVEMMPFLRIPVSPVRAAMAGAGTASTYGSDAYAALGGGAFSMLYGGRTFDGAASWQSWSPNVGKRTSFSAGTSFMPLEKVAFSLAVSAAEYSKIDTFSPSDMILGAGATAFITDKISAALMLRYASQKIWEDTSYNAFCADLLVQYRPVADLSLVAGLSSMGPKVKSDSGDAYPIPSSLVLAGEYVYRMNEWGLRPMIDLDLYLSGYTSAAAAMEISWSDSVFLRGAYRYAADNASIPTYFSVGAGVRFYGVALDFSYITGDDNIGGGLSVGLGYGF